MNQALFTLGKVTGVHGLKGHVKVFSHADSPSVFKPGFSLFVRGEEAEGVWYEIEDAFPYKKGMRILFKGADRNLAESLVGKDLMAPRESLPDLDEDTYYWQDLMGLEVMDLKRGSMGRIKSIFPTGSNDVLVVQGGDGETLVPVLETVIKDVDLDANRMTVDLPEGL